MDMIFSLFFLLGGVVVMLIGMKYLGDGLEKFAGRKMKTLLGKVTNNRLAGVGVGIVVTSIIQSSTATTVMLVGFVNIGLLSLTQAVGIIMGANIGTTITAHIVSLSSLGIGSYAAFIGFIGIMMNMLSSKDTIKNIGNILAGLGLIFVGLEFMSINSKLLMFNENGEPYPIVRTIFQGNHFPLLLVVIGILLTALVHSSSTITSLMVVLASIGVLSFDNALFLALGSNIGTCITSIISSIGTCANAKRTAVLHLLFNFFGCIIFIGPLWIWSSKVIELFSSMSNDVGQQIAIFHTMFNAICTIFFLPFANYFVKLACLIVRDKDAEKDEKRFAYLDNLMMQTPAIAVSNIKNEIIRMGEFARDNINNATEMLFETSKDNAKIITEKEEVLNFLNHSITSFMTKLISKDLSVEDDNKLASYFHVVSDLERVGDYAENIMEYSLRLRKEELNFSDEAKQELREAVELINNLFDVALKAFNDRDVIMLNEVDKIEQKIDDLSKVLEDKHIERVKKGSCQAQLGSIYLQTVSNLERVGDHITNVAFSIGHYRHIEKSILTDKKQVVE